MHYLPLKIELKVKQEMILLPIKIELKVKQEIILLPNLVISLTM